VICNPPYGERLGDHAEAATLYKRFGEVLKNHYVHWQAALIISDPELGFRIGIRSQKPVTVYNGALACKLLRMSIEESAFFIPKPKTAVDRIQLISADAAKQEADRQDLDSFINYDIDTSSFINRLQKNKKRLASWLRQNNVSCYRLYDADLPDFAVAIDIYQDEDSHNLWVNVQEYEPPKNIDPIKANQRLTAALQAIGQFLSIPQDHLFLKIRRKQKQLDQYEKLTDNRQFHTVTENGCRLQVNFTDYLDTGLFLDHRPIRLMIQQQAKHKRFLNLFAYTGSATVHAAIGGAKSSTTVDMSNTYLDWAKQNLALNKVSGDHDLIQADCLDWLAEESSHPYRRQYDLIFLDPPTFSNSKRMDESFDIQRDHSTLIKQAVKLLSKTGILYFSTNFRRFKLDHAALSGYLVEDITPQTIPLDFSRNPKIHYCWRISQ
jgi:23S rRNA (guanine2445-N2)-methyltransferase / 23S rRNA (guanine2069-N7)-methyltransferase